MSDPIGDAELARCLAQCVDAAGEDVALQRETAAMSHKTHGRSHENLRNFVNEVREEVRRQHG